MFGTNKLKQQIDKHIRDVQGECGISDEDYCGLEGRAW